VDAVEGRACSTQTSSFSLAIDIASAVDAIGTLSEQLRLIRWKDPVLTSTAFVPRDEATKRVFGLARTTADSLGQKQEPGIRQLADEQPVAISESLRAQQTGTLATRL
jgi:hypothetical protein